MTLLNIRGYIFARTYIFNLRFPTKFFWEACAPRSGAAGLMLHFARRGLYVAMGILTHTAVSALLT